MLLRMVCISKISKIYSITTEDRNIIDNLLLEIEEREGIKIYKIIDKSNGNVIERYPKT